MRLPIALLICLGFLAACNKDPAPPPAMPVESAGDAMKRDNADIAKRLEEQKAEADKGFNDARAAEERARMIAVLTTARESFARKVDAAFAATRNTMAPIVKELEIQRAEAEGLPVNNCTLPIKSEMLAGMSSAIEGLNLFIKETADQSEASKAKMLDGSTKLAGMANSLKACQ
jgi:hypothetical protein